MPSTVVPVETHQVRVSFPRDRRGACSWVLNLLWLLLGGWHLFLSWFVVGILLCCSIILCPCGIQVIKIACFLLFPFGTSIVVTSEEHRGCLCTCDCVLNVVWILTAGWILALQALCTGILLCLSIVGIPFGIQCFKLAYISFWPFGLEVSSQYVETVTLSTARYVGLEEGEDFDGRV